MKDDSDVALCSKRRDAAGCWALTLSNATSKRILSLPRDPDWAGMLEKLISRGFHQRPTQPFHSTLLSSSGSLEHACQHANS